MTAPPTRAGAGLGIDAGGTQTRWALLAAEGSELASGEAPALCALQLNDASSRAQIEAVLGQMAGAVAALGAALRVQAVCAGITGFDLASGAVWQAMLAQAFGMSPEHSSTHVELSSDIEMTCRCAFAPGEGGVLVAGTGSIAGHVDAAGGFHRVGGRGVLLDDAGGGHWIAVQALRQVWRAEDEAPGAWRHSALACRLFEHIGGSVWADTRRAVYAATRGEVGRLALAVGAAARDGDAAALELLRRAGEELARLARVLSRRHGIFKLALTGRVFELSPEVELGLRDSLQAAVGEAPVTIHPVQGRAELAFARRAWQRALDSTSAHD